MKISQIINEVKENIKIEKEAILIHNIRLNTFKNVLQMAENTNAEKAKKDFSNV